MTDNGDVVLQDDAKAAMVRFQTAAAEHAINTMPREDQNLGRLTKVVQIKGHLFDTTVLNRIMDFCVDSQSHKRI